MCAILKRKIIRWFCAKYRISVDDTFGKGYN